MILIISSILLRFWRFVVSCLKLKKYHYTHIFLNPSHPDGGNISVLVATSGVGNFGFDSPDIRNVFRMQFPPSSLDFVQDIGQAGRVQPQYPENYSYVIYYSIKNFLYIFENLCNPDETYINILEFLPKCFCFRLLD